jgi:hypothetical protein
MITTCNTNKLHNLVKDNIPLEKKIYKGMIEIKKLPKSSLKVVANYKLNYNSINNNNISIKHDVIDPLNNTCDIDDINYNLINIEFRKSNFSYYNNPIGLELHLIHTNYNSIYNYNIIIPLDLNSNPKQKNNENFINIFYNKMDQSIKTSEPILAEITDDTKLDSTLLTKINFYNKIKKEKNKFNLKLLYDKTYDVNTVSINKLINNSNLIPNYQCCGTIIGPYKEFNLCIINTIINNSNFYILEDEYGNNILITDPAPFNEDIGLLIRNNISQNNINYFINNIN